MIWLGPWLLLSPHRTGLLRREGRPGRGTTTLVALSAAAALGWLAGAGRSGPLQVPGLVQEARFDLVGLTAAVVLVGAWAALIAPGRRWTVAVVGCAVALVGVLALIWPDGVASPARGPAWSPSCWAAPSWSSPATGPPAPPGRSSELRAA